KRAFVPDARQDRLDELAVELERPVVDAPVAAARHDVAEVRPELDREQRRLVRPVLEYAATSEQRRNVPRVERTDSSCERQPVRAVDRGDRVELNGGE